MNRIFMFSILLSTILCCAACGNDPLPSNSTGGTSLDGGSAGSDAGNAGADAGGATADAGPAGAEPGPKYVCNPPTGKTTPTRDQNCAAFDDKVHGCKYPWAGFVAGTQSFTCNACRGGDPLAQGAWRFVDFTTEDPTTPLNAELKQRLVVDGNTWHLRRSYVKDGVKGDIRIDGWYFCSDAAEMPSKDVVWVVTAVSPPGGFGYEPGSHYSGTFKTKGTDMLAWGLYEGMHSGKHFEEIYCRVGTKVQDKDCTDPFGP